MKNILLLPFHVLRLFTGAKDFRKPVVGNQTLNKWGLHKARVRMTHGIFALKQFLLKGLVSENIRQSYAQDGFVMIENVLPEEDFKALKSAAINYKGEAFECVQGDTITWRSANVSETVKNILADKKISHTLKYVAGKFERPRFYIEQIQNGYANDALDPQKNLHVDTFHPTMKAWLFLEDVTEDNGPFTYVPGSHRLTKERLDWEYQRSLTAANDEDSYSARGSFRVEDGDVEKLGLPPPRALKVKANTLVVANTFGFHCRGEPAQKQSTRLEIFAISRVNPFNPLPFGMGENLRDKVYLKAMRLLDKRAKEKGTQASWQRRLSSGPMS